VEQAGESVEDTDLSVNYYKTFLPGDVFEQLTAERLVTRYVKGHPRMEWVKPAGKRNEALDCAVYALACTVWLHMDRWRESEWAKWQARVETADLFSAAAPPQAAEQPAPPPEQQPPQPTRRRPTPSRGGFATSW
jgi:phage terminase large subunit GpA-like protein